MLPIRPLLHQSALPILIPEENNVPRKIYLDTNYIALLSQNKRHQANVSLPIDNMIDFINHLIATRSEFRSEYTFVLDGLIQAQHSVHEPDIAASARHISDRLVQQNRALLLCVLAIDTNSGHAVLLELIPETSTKTTIRVYNSGYAIKAHAKHFDSKFETMFEVTGVRLNQQDMEKFLSYISESGEDFYAWIAQKGTVNNNIPQRITQRHQKGSDCTQECIMAYLRNNLSERAYKTAKATLFNGAQTFVRKNYTGDKNVNAWAGLFRRYKSAQDCLERADFYQHEADQAQGQSWYLGPTDGGAVANQFKEMKQTHFAILRQPDVRGHFEVIWNQPAEEPEQWTTHRKLLVYDPEAKDLTTPCYAPNHVQFTSYPEPPHAPNLTAVAESLRLLLGLPIE